VLDAATRHRVVHDDDAAPAGDAGDGAADAELAVGLLEVGRAAVPVLWQVHADVADGAHGAFPDSEHRSY